MNKKFTCKQCDKQSEKIFSSLITTNNFCDRSCAAKFNNTKPKRIRQFNNCLDCGSQIDIRKKFCNVECNSSFKKKESIKNILSGTASTAIVKKYLLSIHGNICSKCHNSEWNGVPITIELEHSDGNSDNNNIENCCLLCPNCHAQTPTYKAKNIGNGRHKRRLRYQEGKSF